MSCRQIDDSPAGDAAHFGQLGGAVGRFAHGGDHHAQRARAVHGFDRQQLVFALGIGYQGASPLQPDLAIALVMTLALMLLVLEAAASLLQQLLDPRLRELRTEGQ